MHDVSLSRRHLLAGGLAAGIAASAGCLGIGTDATSEDTGPKLTLSLTRVDGPLRNKYVREREDPEDHWDELFDRAARTDAWEFGELHGDLRLRPTETTYDWATGGAR